MTLPIKRSADEAVRFLHPAVELALKDVYEHLLLRELGKLLVPRGAETASSLTSPTSTPCRAGRETRVLRSIADADRVAELGEIRVTLTTRGGDP